MGGGEEVKVLTENTERNLKDLKPDLGRDLCNGDFGLLSVGVAFCDKYGSE